MRRDRLIKSLVRRRIVATLKTGETFDGILWDADRQTLALVDCKVLGDDSPIPADGTIYLDRANVAYVQNV